MGLSSIWHWLILLLIVVLLLSARGKISDIMGDVAKGIKSFKKGMAEDEDEAARDAGGPHQGDRPAGPAHRVRARARPQQDELTPDGVPAGSRCERWPWSCP